MRDKLDITIEREDSKRANTAREVPHASERTAEDKTFVRNTGLSLVTHFFSACKTVRLYDINNRASQRALKLVAEDVARIVDREGSASLRVAGDFLVLNDYRLPIEPQYYGPFEYVGDEMKKRQVETILFNRKVTAQEIGVFLQALLGTDAVEAAYNELQKQMAIDSVDGIETTRLEEREPELTDITSDEDLKLRSNRVYFRTVALMGEILRTIEEKHLLHVKKAKRLTQQMVDIIQTDESMFVGLASIKNFDSYTFMHSVNVCILSMMMGDRLKLKKSDVARLGVAALFHDIGKTYIPSSILNSTGALSPREWELMKYHTFFGVKELSRIRSLHDAADPMFVALQHHVHLNDNGYPQRPGGWKLRLFSRIVTVADYYDAMTSSRSYQQDPITPDKALRFILEKSGEIFDPFIAKLFIQAMGIYPAGTIVELNTGELAIVVRQNEDPRHIHRPVVEIIDRDSESLADRESVDLAEQVSEECRFERSVVRTVHDSDAKIDKRPFFVHTEG